MPLGGLELPDRRQRGGEDWLQSSEAGRLFIDGATRAHPGFLLDHAGVAAVAQICERLDGIPLALELAAARARLMSVHAIAEGLSDRFHLLIGSGRAGPPRQKTLLASIEWSCALLREDERALLRRLSVFASGFSLGAAQAVCTGGEVEDDAVLGLLTSLVDKSLVQVDAGADRFRLHETMRAYAGAALDGDGRAPQAPGTATSAISLGWPKPCGRSSTPPRWSSPWPRLRLSWTMCAPPSIGASGPTSSSPPRSWWRRRAPGSR